MKETAAQKKKRLIRLIHVAKSQLMMGDAEYRAMLANLSCGKTSSIRLSAEELELALRAMQQRGFVIRAKRQAAVRSDLPIYRPREELAGQVGKIRALWLELHALGAVRNPSEAALAEFVKRHTGIAHPNWLDIDKASQIIEHLKKWKQRFG